MLYLLLRILRKTIIFVNNCDINFANLEFKWQKEDHSMDIPMGYIGWNNAKGMDRSQS